MMQEVQYKRIQCTINGKPVQKMVDVRASLTDLLRNDFNLHSVKKGCEVGECGACNVLIDGECFNSCIYLAIWADGKEIRTLESLLSQRRADARAECADWRTWSLSAWLASRGGA